MTKEKIQLVADTIVQTMDAVKDGKIIATEAEMAKAIEEVQEATVTATIEALKDQGLLK